MILEQNREIIRQLYMEVTAMKQPDNIYRSKGKGFTQYTVSAKPSSLKTFNQFFASVSEAFPDYELKIDNLIVKGDRVLARYSVTGTHKGKFMGMTPTNERMIITGIDIFRLDNGRIVEHWDAAHQVNALPGFNREAPLKSSTWRPNSLIASPTRAKQLSLSTH